MAILFTLISLIISISVPLLLLIFTDITVLHFSLFFIIPVGGLIIGYIGCFGFFRGLHKKNVFLSGKFFLIGILLSLTTIFGIKYGEYYLTHVAADGSGIVYSLSGDHISNYMGPGDKPFNFVSFTKLMVESTPVSFSYKSRSLGSVSNVFVCWALYLVDLLGVIIGGAIAGSSISSKPYCHTCKKYMKEKDSFGVLATKGDEFFKNLSEHINKGNSREITSYINNFRVDLPLKREPHYKCIIQHCDVCRKATLKIELYTLNSKKALVLNNKFKFSAEINYTAAIALLNEHADKVLSV